MNILFNATTLNKGGIVNRAVNFLRESRRHANDIHWQIAVSATVLRELERVEKEPFPDCEVFTQSPARSLSSRRRLSDLERQLRPDAVFTIGGPAYVRLQAPHLLGCSTGWVTHADWIAYRSLSIPQMATVRLDTVYKDHWFRQADAWVVQTEVSRRGLQRRLRLPLERIAVVPNTFSAAFQPYVARTPVFPGPEPWRILCLAASYPHKRLDLVPDVAHQLRRQLPNVDFHFVLTLPATDPLWLRITERAAKLGVRDRLCNVGPVAIANLPELYLGCHLSFLPTVFETFSATYPESMAMGLPIITSDRPFARDTCGSAAAYFTAGNAQSAANSLCQLMQQPELRLGLVDRGRAHLKHFPSAEDQFQQYLTLIRQLATTTPRQGR